MFYFDYIQTLSMSYNTVIFNVGKSNNDMLGLTSSGLPAPLSIVSKNPSEFLLSDNRPLFDPLEGSVTGCLYTSIWKNTYKQKVKPEPGRSSAKVTSFSLTQDQT